MKTAEDARDTEKLNRPTQSEITKVAFRGLLLDFLCVLGVLCGFHWTSCQMSHFQLSAEIVKTNLGNIQRLSRNQLKG